MSIRFIGAVWDSGLYDGPRLLMMLALADHADDDGWCWPRYETLALKIRRNAKTVYRVLADLEEHGAIRRDGEHIVISEPAIVEEAARRAGARNAETRPRKILNNEKEILNNEKKQEVEILNSENDFLNNENEILKNENDFLNSENDFLKNEKPFFIEPSMNRQLTVRGSGADAPARAPGMSSQFQPVPENIRRWQRDERPEPALTANAPPAMRLMTRVTGYWPGEDNSAFLVERLGDAPDEAALRRAVELWRAAGHRPTNWIGICDWYQEVIRDPAWTPSARFKSPPQAGQRPAQPAQPVKPMREIAPGLY